MQELKMSNLDYMNFVIGKLSPADQSMIRAAIKDIEDACGAFQEDVAAIAVAFVVAKYEAKS